MQVQDQNPVFLKMLVFCSTCIFIHFDLKLMVTQSVLMADYSWCLFNFVSECSLHSSHPSPGVTLNWFSRRLAAIGQPGNLNKYMFIVFNIATLLWV